MAPSFQQTVGRAVELLQAAGLRLGVMANAAETILAESLEPLCVSRRVGLLSRLSSMEAELEVSTSRGTRRPVTRSVSRALSGN